MAREITEILTQMSEADQKRRTEIAQRLYQQHFSTYEARKSFIREFAEELRLARKNALKTGNEKQTELDEERQIAFLMIFRFCPVDLHRQQIGDVLIEGLKYQQKDIKRYCYEYADKNGFLDIGWIHRMLDKKYVSKWSWKYLRVHYNDIVPTARVILLEKIKFWAEDAVTQKKWKELDQEFGEPFDFVAKFAA